MAAIIVTVFCLFLFGAIGAGLVWVLSTGCRLLAAMLPEPNDAKP